MTPGGALAGEALLFRVCSVPMQRLAAAGNPGLFAALAAADAAEAELQRRSKAAARGANELINRACLPRPDSRRLGEVVSRLQRGASLRCRDLEAVDSILGSRNPALAAEVGALQQARARLETRKERLHARIEGEPERAAAALWRACAVPLTRRLLAHRDPDFLKRCTEHGDTIEHWGGTRGRHRAGYLYDIISRAAVRTIPRDWHAYVTTLPIADAARATSTPAAFATLDIENLHEIRQAIARAWPEDRRRARLCLTPLHWGDDETLSVLASNLDDPLNLSEVTLRRTDYLNAVLQDLDASTISYRALADRLALTEEDNALLQGFVGHLVRIGVIMVARDPSASTRTWSPAPRSLDPPAADARRGYLDVFARCDGAVARDRALKLQDGFRRLARLALLLEAEKAVIPTSKLELGSEYALRDLLRDQLRRKAGLGDTTRPPRAPPSPGEWPEPRADSTAPYTRLIAWLAPRVASGRPIVVGDSDLDAVGAPEWSPRWPVDAMVRLAGPDAGYQGVFDEAFAAGSMDARFIGGATALGVSMPQHAWYLRFLRAVETQIGERFLEVLVPPLSSGAANAIRRPVHVRHWTGDPDCASYYGEIRGDLEYVDLLDLTIRVTPRGKRVMRGERMLFPMYHATRQPIPPWDVLTEALLNAVPFQLRWSPGKMRRLLDGFPDARFTPRLELEGGLVACPAQWRLGGEIDWRNSDPWALKMSALARLRQRLGLPRMVFVSPAPGRRPTFCDLESLAGLMRFEAFRDAGDPLAIEFLPAPADAFFQTGAGSHSSSTMLRFPLHIGAEEFAEQICPDLL